MTKHHCPPRTHHTKCLLPLLLSLTLPLVKPTTHAKAALFALVVDDQ